MAAMTQTHATNQYIAFLGGPIVTPFCVNDDDLILHDYVDGDEAWLAMQDACYLNDWR